MSSSNPHRIDPPGEPARPKKLRSRRPGGYPANSDPQRQYAVGNQVDKETDSGLVASKDQSAAKPFELPLQDDLVHFHASDLIDRLQGWAADLDAREAQLNARSSLQDHRERRFRLNQQDASTEIAEQQRSIERLREEVEAQARRLAFRDQVSD